MNLMIKIENGQPVGHPVFVENFMQSFPGVDPFQNGYAPFERVAAGAVEKYQVATGNHNYGWVGDVVKDIWETREMTPDERADLDAYEQFQNETE
jgi:hypothetical protein